MDQPPWLRSVIEDKGPTPKLFAWSPHNLTEGTADGALASYSRPFTADPDKRIYILGIGNLGILFATALSKITQRPPITLVVHRKELLEQWAAEPGLEVTRQGAGETTKDFDIEWWTDQEPTMGPKRHVADGSIIHNLLVSTKASAALPEVDRLRGYLNGSSTVAFAQNGMCKLWPPYGEAYNKLRYPDGNHPNWMACSVTHGVFSRGRFRAEHASEADLKIGPVLLSQHGSTAHEYLPAQLQKAPRLHCKIVAAEDLWILQLEKLVVNTIINPLTAVLRCKNGVLFEDTSGPLRTLIDQLIKEASDVLRALIRHPSTDAILGTSEQERALLLQRFSAPHLTEMVDDVGHKVRQNTSSMLQDVQVGKQTEIRDMNGWLVDMAAFLGGAISVRHHEILIGLVEKGVALDVAGLRQHFDAN